MRILKPARYSVILMALPIVAINVLDVAQSMVPGIEPLGIYIAIAMGQGMIAGVLYERYILSRFRNRSRMNHDT
jgi:hypothetical protein